MRDISRATGVSLAGLYHYCKSKEELLFLIQDHCFGRVLERLEQRTRGIDDPFEKLRIFIDNHLSFFAANMAEMKVLSHEAESLAGDLHEHVSTRKTAIHAHRAKILSEVQQTVRPGSESRAPRRNGQLKKTAKPADLTVATYALFGMMNWITTGTTPRASCLSVNSSIIYPSVPVGFLSSADESFALADSGSAEKVNVWRTA